MWYCLYEALGHHRRRHTITKLKGWQHNPLTMNDDYSRHQNSATCYQLAQFVLKIGSALAERVGRGKVGGCHLESDRAWWSLQLTVETPWSMPGGPFFHFLVQTDLKNTSFTLYGLCFWPFRQLSVWRSPPSEHSLMSGCGQGHELLKDLWKKLWIKFLALTHSKSGNTGEKRCD